MKKIGITLIIFLICIIFSNIIFAGDALSDPSQYKPDQESSDTARTIENITSNILTLITDVGIVVSVIMLGTIGIKYIIGSVEERAEYKEAVAPYLIGAMLLFGITTFVKIIVRIGNAVSLL